MAIVLLANSIQFGAAQSEPDMVAAGMVADDGAFDHHPAASKLLAAKVSGVRAKVSGVREHFEAKVSGVREHFNADKMPML